MKIKRGDRVRCVNNDSIGWALTVGKTYIVAAVSRVDGTLVWLCDASDNAGHTLDGMCFLRERFKPVVRVAWVLAS